MSLILMPSERSDSWRNEADEESARKLLKAIDPLLDLAWMDGVSRYALLCTWPQSDRRWSMYQSGEIGQPYDVIGWFAEPQADGSLHSGEGLPLNPLEMMDRVTDFLGKMDNTRSSWQTRMKFAIEHNRKLEADRTEAIVDETMDEFEYMKKKVLHEPIVALNLGRAVPKREKGD